MLTKERDTAPPIVEKKFAFQNLEILDIVTWDEEFLKNLSDYCGAEIVPEGEFLKRDNPLLNGLKKFSSHHDVFCNKCAKFVRTTKKGFVKEAYQFVCESSATKHGLSANQIFGSLPDSWLEKVTKNFEASYRGQILKWLGKEQLDTELWETKGLKNAMKRFSNVLSPIKGDASKIRAVNNGLEEENRVLKEKNSELQAKIEELISAQKIMAEEIKSLRKYILSEKNVKKPEKEAQSTTKSEVGPTNQSQRSFAEVTGINRPVKKNTRTPL